jgi:DNA-binding transcriptional regulator/RsmH inhibitor MraZ
MDTNLAPTHPTSFTRNVDAEGYLELPDYLLDDYGQAWITLGFGVYLHVMNDGVWLEFSAALKQSSILDERAADLQDRMFPYATRLKQDAIGRVQIPRELLNLASIKTRVIGKWLGVYWRLYDLELYLKRTTLPAE